MQIRLGPLPKTDPVKLTIAVSAETKDRLERYAQLHATTWNEPVELSALIPYMLEQFMSRDKAFKSYLRRVSVRTPRPKTPE
jgi:hypothetical protein